MLTTSLRIDRKCVASMPLSVAISVKRSSRRPSLCDAAIAVRRLPASFLSDAFLLVCSTCLRGHLLYAETHHFDVGCPECRQRYGESDIRAVVTLSSITSLYKKIRPTLLEDTVHVPSPPAAKETETEAEETEGGGSELKVPPLLHMNSLTAAQLKRKLSVLKLSTDGNKQELVARYKRFRMMVQVERDEGGKRGMEELAWHFEKKENGKKNDPVKKLDAFFPKTTKKKKTHKDLVEEIKARKQQQPLKNTNE